MNRMLLSMFVIGIVSSTALAQHAIQCDGTESTGSGAVSCDANTRLYAYPVTAVASDIETIQIGTDDCQAFNYTNICMPAGWTFNVIPNSSTCDTVKTAHGDPTNGTPSDTCGCAIQFTKGGGTPIAAGASFIFGFDNSKPSHDVSWKAVDLGGAGSTSEMFGMPSGNGVGPVHGPTKASPIPTVSEWGMAAMVLLVLVTGTVVFRRLSARRLA